LRNFDSIFSVKKILRKVYQFFIFKFWEFFFKNSLVNFKNVFEWGDSQEVSEILFLFSIGKKKNHYVFSELKSSRFLNFQNFFQRNKIQTKNFFSPFFKDFSKKKSKKFQTFSFKNSDLEISFSCHFTQSWNKENRTQNIT